MEHKSWSWAAIFCVLIHAINSEPGPIVFKSAEDSQPIPRTIIKSPQQKRNVDEGEQQWLTKSIPVISSSETVDATQTPPSTLIEMAFEVKSEEISKKIETEEKVEEKLAIPVAPVPVVVPVAKVVVPVAPIKKLSLQLGQSCDPNGEKTSCYPENSSCTRYAEGIDVFFCNCNENYESISSGVCVRSEGSPCNYRKGECSQSSTYLSCINSKCICEKSDIYNPVTKKCEAKVGGTCFGEKMCIANAYCSKLSYSDFSISPVGVCECKKGFVESENSLCMRAYGRTCTKNDECDRLNLVCREGTCHCSDSLQRYDFKTKSCRSVVGAECPADDGDKSCVEGAYCKITNRKLSGRCYCMSPLVQSEYRTCVRSSAWYPGGGYS